MSDLFQHDALRGRLTDAASVRRFLEAGNATLTLVSRATGGRYTVKFQRLSAEADTYDRSESERPIFVKLLSGPDNEGDYTYMGTMTRGTPSELVRTRKSRVSESAPSWKAVQWLLYHLYHANGSPDKAMDQLEVWHEGRCGRCGRKLTVPLSVRTGFGPDCAELMGLAL